VHFGVHLSRLSEAVWRRGTVHRITPAIGLPAYAVYVAGAIEFFGGLALALGFVTRVAGIFLMLDMCVALWKYNFNQA